MRLLKKIGLTAGVFALGTTSALASTGITASDNFHEFYEFVEQAATGGLGTGIALAGLLIGAGIGAAKATAMPAIGGVVIAAVFGFGPDIILKLATNGAMI